MRLRGGLQMKIPHKVTFVVGGIYRVSAAFPIEKHLIDVLTFQARACYWRYVAAAAVA